MSPLAISVTGLSKRYLLRHRAAGGRSYDTLRDMLAARAARLWRRPRAGADQTAGDATREEFWALRDLDFEVRQGDRIGIIGRNGAGKSTLLKILSRITEPTSGRIQIAGRLAALLEVGTGFHPELTGRENIYLNGAILGMRQAEISARFDAIVDFAEVERFLDTPVKRYSSGMYLRLGFAVAAHLEPEILVVDEVLAVGDAQFQAKCLGKLDEFGQEGRTVLFVSHNIHAIAQLCNRGILLENGGLAADDHISAVIQRYLFNNRAFALSRAWRDDAMPGSDAIRLRRVAAFPDGQGPSIDASAEVAFEVELEVQRETRDTVVSLLLVEQRRGTILHSESGVMLPDAALPPGRHLFRHVLPSGVLPAGTFSLTVAIANPHVEVHVHERDVLTLSIHSSNSHVLRYPGQSWQGAIGPECGRWQHQAGGPA